MAMSQPYLVAPGRGFMTTEFFWDLKCLLLRIIFMPQ